MDYAKAMGYTYPDTAEKRRAGMAAFRAKILAVHTRLASDPKLSAKERAHQAALAESIRRVQAKFGESK